MQTIDKKIDYIGSRKTCRFQKMGCKKKNLGTSDVKLFFNSYFSSESGSVSHNLSLVMEFLGNVFNNFILEKLLSQEALVMGRVTATTTSNNQMQLIKKLQI